MAEAGGRDLKQFSLWYSQAGTPELEVETAYDETRQVYTLRVRQSCPPTPDQANKQPFHIPLAMGLLDRNGNDLPLQLEGEAAPEDTTRVLELRREEEIFRFVGVPSAPVPSLLRGFSAPVKLRLETSDKDLAFLMAHDRDPFNRWEAGQRLSVRIMLGLIEDFKVGREPMLDAGFIAAFRRSLLDQQADPALLAQALLLPAESYLAEQMEVADPEAIHGVRECMRRALAKSLREEFVQVMETHILAGPYSIEPAAVGRRSLKNLCLAYLMTLEEPEIVARCLDQFSRADNMTDVSAALTCLASSETPERVQVLEAFYLKWQHEPLVVDKWFALQATSRRPDTLENVKRLMSHPAFNIKNPNKVRALIGAFCHGNPARFHDRSGAGYAFHGDQVLAIDRLNPQVAARLLQAVTRWRKYDEARQGMMRNQIERIAATPGISPDIYEIASKSLA
jgi:aminopeptidase N